MRTLPVLALCGTLFTLCANADAIYGPASTDRYSLASLSSQGGRDLGRGRAVRGVTVEQVSHSVAAQTGGNGSKIEDGEDLFASNLVWKPITGAVTRSTSQSENWTHSKVWNERADTLLHKGEGVADITVAD